MRAYRTGDPNKTGKAGRPRLYPIDPELEADLEALAVKRADMKQLVRDGLMPPWMMKAALASWHAHFRRKYPMMDSRTVSRIKAGVKIGRRVKAEAPDYAPHVEAILQGATRPNGTVNAARFEREMRALLFELSK
jgi:hypothetical protein